MSGASKARIRKQIVTLAIAATAVVAAGAGIETVAAQPLGQQMDYYQSAPSYTPHGIPIPGHLAAQAMQARYQQAAYNAGMGCADGSGNCNGCDGRGCAGCAGGGAGGGGGAAGGGGAGAGGAGGNFGGGGGGSYYDGGNGGNGGGGGGGDFYGGGNGGGGGGGGFYGGGRGGGGARGILGNGPGPAALMTAQRYDDHSIYLTGEFVYLRREDSNQAGPITGLPPATLNTGLVDLNNWEGGARVSAFIDFFYSFDLELTYMGQLDWGQSRTVGPDTIAYDSSMNNFEMNARFRWVHSNQPWTGSWIMGVRYLQLDERFLDRGVGGDFLIAADNDLVGFQIGHEIMGSVASGWLIGGDVKAGIYGNRATNSVNGGPKGVGRQAAFVGEGNFMVVAELGHGMYLRGGYTAMFVNGLSLGPDAYNRAIIAGSTLVPTGGNLFVHGIFGGFGWQY